MNKKNLAFLLMLIVVLSSCSVTKRHYRKGFHVEWHKNIHVDGSSVPSGTHDAVAAVKKEKATAAMPEEIKEPLQVQAEPVVVPAGPGQKTIIAKTGIKKSQAVKVIEKEKVQPLDYPENEEKGNQVLAEKYAKKSLVLGIIGLVLVFIIAFFALFIGMPAVKKARQANELNESKDPKITKRARLGRLFGLITVYAAIILFVLLMTLIVLAILGVV